jgi:predicted RNA binding protein YcfA (HicA-like mRNA interferase family)
MSKLKRISGADAIAIFKKFGFDVHSQKGSHIKLRRITPLGKEKRNPDDS